MSHWGRLAKGCRTGYWWVADADVGYGTGRNNGWRIRAFGEGRCGCVRGGGGVVFRSCLRKKDKKVLRFT